MSDTPYPLRTFTFEKACADELLICTNTGLKLGRSGKLKSFRGHRNLQSDAKKAIITLEEGHSIDVTTGL